MPNYNETTNLNIREACCYAAATGKYITRRNRDGMVWFKVEPTDSEYWLCALLSANGLNKVKGWQPSLADLIATDWEVVD